MELLKYVRNIIRPYVRTNEILDQINIYGLDADFVKIYNDLKAEGNINLMPQQVFKYIEDVALGEFHQIERPGDIYACEMTGIPPQPYDRGLWQREYSVEWSG
jgi:hypothetical protein